MGVARSSPNLAPAGKDPRDCREQRRSKLTGSPIALPPDERPSSPVVPVNLHGREMMAHLRDRAMLGRLPAAVTCLSFLLVIAAAPLHALAQDERPVPPLPRRSAEFCATA